MTKVSVIVPIYNVEQYLKECLQSLVDQTLKDIQIICVNDGSTDGSADIVRKFMKKDDRIVLIEQENKGLSEARNAGLDYEGLEGEYIYFLDSDDYLDLDALQILYDKAVELQLDILGFKADPFTRDEGLEEIFDRYSKYYDVKGEYDQILTGPEMMALMFSNNEYRMSVALSLVRRAHIEDNKLRFIPGIVHEDNAYTFENYLKAQRVGFIPLKPYKRRIRPGSIMSSKKKYNNSKGYFVCFLRMSHLLDERDDLPQDIVARLTELVMRVYLNSVSDYKSLSEEDRASIAEPEDLTALKHTFLVRHEADRVLQSKEDAKRIKEDLNSKLEKTYAEKSELNALLQKTYDEKSEINATLQRTYAEKSELGALLQKTYDEKAEINATLQRTYAEKSELGALLQKTYDEKAEINATLQRTYAEKSELNALLQQTYAEKSEINAKLQLTYKEKAERGIIIKEQKKTIKTQEDKIKKQKDRIIDLKQKCEEQTKRGDDLAKDKADLTDRLKKSNKELSDIKGSKTYKFAKALSKPFRFIKKKMKR